MLTQNDIQQIKTVVQDIVSETVLDSEKRIRKDMAVLKLDLQQYTHEGVDTVINTLEEMFPEKSLKSKSVIKNIA